MPLLTNDNETLLQANVSYFETHGSVIHFEEIQFFHLYMRSWNYLELITLKL